ncbi:DNRLRE domain-containing protein [Vallitalea pronyensis]|uniref:DNRLRE domain-containing protein n=1 Tax=Vallitalea pronyensis TaxID=1348613 RepID=A0A8J8SIC0_9FIRM|nr:DNRLRE domain-containing protein [Vallitalea pronyensis]QUI24760.1 DNRLRE domain-containing protein [Vallitalea pronyensis]
MKHKSTRTILSIVLMIALLVSIIVPSNTAYAETSPDQVFYDIPEKVQTISDDVSFSTSNGTQKELTQFRTRKSKRYINADGSFTEKIYAHPVNYKDKKTGKWQPIQSNLKAEKDAFKNIANEFDISLHKHANGFVTYSEEGSSLSFRPTFASSVKGSVQDNVMTFEEVTTATDMTYAVTPYGLKETLILKSKDAPTLYTYEIKLKDLTYVVQDDGSVIFSKPGNHEPLFTFEKPFLLDDNFAMSTNVSYQFREEKGSKIYMDLIGDVEWLQSPERVYPIIFDPTINTLDVDALSQDTLLSSSNPNTNYDMWAHFYVGLGSTLGTCRSLLWFNLPAIPSGAVISNASLNVLNTQVYVTSQTPVLEVHRVTSDWTANTVTWQSKPSTGSIDGSITMTNTAGPHQVTIPITGLVNDWYSGTQDNYGLQLQYSNESLASREFLASNDVLNPTNHPSLTIDYTIDGLGQQSYWTFDGSVNMANGNLVYEDRDIDFPGRGVDVTLDRTYNSRSTASGVFGYGWYSVMDMRLYIPAKGPAKLIEANGSTHFFSQNTDSSYNSPPGMYWQLSGNQASATITTSDKMQYTFTDSKLTQIKDPANNTLTLVYTNDQVTGIKDNADNTITLTYLSGRIATATDPANRTWLYDYDGNGNLIKVTTPDSKLVQYRYDQDHNLIATISPKGDTTYIIYTGTDRVASINPVNAVTNGNFEVDANGNGIPDYFYIWTGQTGQESIDSSSGSAYGKAFKINTSSANTYFYTVYLSDPIPVDATQTYTLSSYLKAQQNSGTLTTVISLLAYDENDISLGEFARIEPTGTFDWNRYEKSEALPSNTDRVRIKFGATVASGSGSSWWDGIQLETGTTASDLVIGMQYTSNYATSQSATYDGEGRKKMYTFNDYQNVTKIQQDPVGLNLTDNFVWDTDMVDGTNIPNALRSQQDPKGYEWKYAYNPSTGNVEKVTDPKNGEQTFQWDSASNLTKYTGVNNDIYNMTYDDKKNNMTTRDPYTTNISSAKRFDQYNNVIEATTPISLADNLLDNSSFEGNDVGGLPENYSFDTGEPDTWSVVSTDSKFGNKSFKLDASTSNNSFYTLMLSDAITVENVDYVLSGYLKNTQASGTQLTVLSVYTYNNADQLLGEVGRINLEGNISDWQRWSTAINQADLPSGTSKIRVKLGASNSTGTGESYFDAILIQKNPVDTPYNLIDNSSFERGATWPTNWVQAPGGTSSWETTQVYDGSKAVSISNSPAWSGISIVDYISYNPQKKYNLSAFIKTQDLTADVAHIKVEFYDINKIYLGQVESEVLGGTHDWRRLSIDITENAGPTGTVYFRPVLMSGDANGTVYFDNVRLQEGNYVTKYGYNTSNTWVEKRTDSFKNSSTYTYDLAGNIVSITDPLSNVIEFDYWSNSDKLKWVKPSGNDLKIIYDYDNNGNIRSIKNTDPSETTFYNETIFTYNNLDLISSSTDPLNQKTIYNYSPTGGLIEIIKPENKISYDYNDVNLLSNTYLNDSLRYQFSYDKNGNVETINDVLENRTWTATHDNFNQLSSWDDGKGKIDYIINNVGNITQKKLTVGVVTKTENITYNKVNQPATLIDASQKINRFIFNENGHLSTLHSGNDTNQRIDYDSMERLTDVQNKTNTGQVLSSFKYDYRADDYVTKVTDHNSQELTFTYTAKGELKTELLPNGNTIIYTYDPRGNMTKRDEKQSDGTIINTTTFDYDAANQLIKINGLSITSHDGNGNMTSDGTYNYTWSSADRLIQVNKVSDNSLVATYKYDNIGRRVYANTNEQEIYFLYDGYSNNVIAEIDEAGLLKKHYTWSPTGQLLCLTVDGITYYTVLNGHGDIVQLTDINGSVVAEYTYDAWGNILSESGSAASLNPYRYAGYRYDVTTGLYYLIDRYYSPAIGRFLSRDRILSNNIYVYCDNNPINSKDPDGLFGVPALVGGVTIGGSGIGTTIIGGLAAIGPAGWTLLAIGAIGTTIASGIIYSKSKSPKNKRIKKRRKNPSISNKVRSKNPPAKRNYSKSKKDAYQKAKKAGKGKEPIHHPHGNHGPHYHPDVKTPKHWTPKAPNPHDHFNYPRY